MVVVVYKGLCEVLLTTCSKCILQDFLLEKTKTNPQRSEQEKVV